MSSFTPINAQQQGASYRRCHMCVVMGSPKEPCAHPKPPVVEKGASVGSSGSTSSTSTIIKSGKVNNRKPCPRCNGKEYNKSNFADHMKVHYLEDHGVTALVPCKCCEAGECIVARSPKEIETYACISCLKSHGKCSFNGLKTKKGEKCKPGAHPALLRPIEKA